MPTNSSNLSPLLIILVVLLVAVGGYITKEDRWPDVLAKVGLAGEKTFVLESAAAPGEVVAGFPLDLLGIVRDTKVIESGKYLGREVDGRATMLKVSYETAANVFDMFAAYVTFLTDKGYTIERAGSQRGETNINAEKDGEKIIIKMFAKDSKASIVEVSVVKAVIE